MIKTSASSGLRARGHLTEWNNTYSDMIVDWIFNNLPWRERANVTRLEYAWVSPVMDARIIDEKYAVLGTSRSTEGNVSPIIEYYDKHGYRLGYTTFGGDESFRADCFTETKDGGARAPMLVRDTPNPG